MNELLIQLVEFTKTASPIVWAALVKQAYVVGCTYLVWAAVVSALCLLFIRLANYGLQQFKEDPNSEWEYGLVIFLALGVFAGLISVGLFLEGISHLINPEYYALMLILSK